MPRERHLVNDDFAILLTFIWSTYSERFQMLSKTIELQKRGLSWLIDLVKIVGLTVFSHKSIGSIPRTHAEDIQILTRNQILLAAKVP